VNISDLTNIAVGLVTLLLLWQQNRIFQRQNDIFAAQAGIAMPPKMARLERYWPMLAMAALAVAMWLAAAYDRMVTHSPIGTTTIAVPWVLVAVLFMVIAYSSKVQAAPQFGKLTIHSARWVVRDDDQTFIDAAPSLRAQIKKSLIDTIDILAVNANMGGDPKEETHKILKLTYSYGENGAQQKAIKHEGNDSRVTIPGLPDSRISELERRAADLERQLAEESERKSRRRPLAKLALEYDRVLSHSLGEGMAWVLYIKNTQLSVPFTAQYVAARAKFTRDGGDDSCTVTATQWIYEHTEKETRFVGSSIPAYVNIDGAESQRLILAFERPDGGLMLRDCRDATMHFFAPGSSWNAEITIVSDNTETLMLTTKLTVFPNGKVEWSPASEVKANGE